MDPGTLTVYGLLFAGLILAGCATGFAAGLFGIGGGIITVPVLYGVYQAAGSGDEVSLKVAIGTSLALIIVTAARSLQTHHDAGHVDRHVLLGWAPWIAIGSAIGGGVARWIPAEWLGLVFVIGAFVIALRRLRGKRKGPARQSDLSAKRLKIPVGLGAGLFSSLMGLGGGAVGVMVMSLAGRSMHQAIGTSAGFGLAVAIPGAAAFILAGWSVPDLPTGSLGYVNFPSFAVMAVAAAVTAPIGARVAHRMAGDLLSRIFALYVVVAASFLGFDLFFS